MAVLDLVRRGPRNIRKRLFRDIILIILATALAIMLIGFYQGRYIKDYISGQLISEISLLAKKRFTTYLSPFDTSLKLLSRLVPSAADAPASVQALEVVMQSLLDLHQDVSQVSIIGGHGDFREFSRKETGDMQLHSGTWTEKDPYFSRNYNGALHTPENDPVYWSESFTSKNEASGLSAAIRLSPGDSGTKEVLSYFIPAERIISFIAAIEVDNDIDIVLFNNSGLFLSIWNPDYYRPETNQSATGAASLQPTEADILELYNRSSEAELVAQKISMGGNTWWTGFTPLSEDVDRAWIAVIIPETSFIQNVYLQWLEIGAIVGAILLGATLLTVNLVRKYSSQLKDLPQQNLHYTALQDGVTKLIAGGESSGLEFKSTMRNNLQSGKHGKEIEIAWLKAVTAFMNSDGGILLIGVDDDGTIVGIGPDEFSSEDKCRLHFKNLVNSHIGTAFARYIHLRFCSFAEKTICVIECERVRRPVFLRIGKTEDFYIRSGPSSMKLSMSQMVNYLSER